MPSAKREPRSADESVFQRVVEALSSAGEMLLVLGLEQEAREVVSIVDRLTGAGRTAGHNVFRLEGEYRVILYEADVFRLRESVGLAYLAKLLANPGREIHALELVGSAIELASDAGPVLDWEARRAYRLRIDELTADVVEAERANDAERAARCREEIEVLRDQLSAGEGLGRRDRASGSNAERARQAATKAMKSALGRISAHSPELGRHLGSTVRTGTYCRYDPDPRVPIAWRF